MWNSIDSLTALETPGTIVIIVLSVLVTVTPVGLHLYRTRSASSIRARIMQAGTEVLAAFVLGLAAVLISSSILAVNLRADSLEEARRRTPPDLSVGAKVDGERIIIYVESRTEIPFDFIPRVVTKDDGLVSSLATDWTPAYPREPGQVFAQSLSFHPDEVVDGVVEVRVHYRSAYAAELQLPELSGTVTRRYEPR